MEFLRGFSLQQNAFCGVSPFAKGVLIPSLQKLIFNTKTQRHKDTKNNYTQTTSKVGNFARSRLEFEPGCAVAEAAQPE